MKPTDPPSPHDPKKAPARQAPPHDPKKASGGRAAHGPNFPYPDDHNDDVAHEHSDINVRAVIMSAVVVAVTCIVTAILMYALMRAFEGLAEGRDPQLSRLSLPATNMPPTTLTSPKFGNAPEPRLMTNEPVNLQQVREQIGGQLTGYGWVDQSAGVVRIPIEEAKSIMLKRELPVRAEPVTDPRLGTHAPAYGESSSGRSITKPPAAATQATPALAPPHKDH